MSRRNLTDRISDAMLAIMLVPVWWLIAFLVLTAIVAALALPCWQIYTFLKMGYWVSLSVTDGLILVENLTAGPGAVPWAWLRYPSDYIGVHKILSNLPSLLALVCLIYIAVFVLQKIGESIPDAHRGMVDLRI